jgi:methionyl-tRNA synthetase
MAKKTFYITTAIDYVNAEPHIGHAYQKIIADALARWNTLQEKDVFFLTGTDEHGKKVARAAKEANLSPKEFTDSLSSKFKKAWKQLNVMPNRFIRTTDPDHKTTVCNITETINKKGDIYKGQYEGLYCTDCETYYTEFESENGKCPIHKKQLETLKEDTYFFKLSKYQDFLLDLYEKNPKFILPKQRKKEVINRIKKGLKDLSITRTSIDWGIQVPFDKNHVFYVWWEALINYYTATREKGKEKFWPADLHILGVDNMWFHTVIWPAMLKSAGIELPKSIFNHGFLTFNGEKISKSLSNAISPKTLVDKYGTDSLRYFIVRHFPFGEEGDFDEKALINRHNTELANKLGNLVSRVSALAEKYPFSKSTPINSKPTITKVSKHFEMLEFDKALNEIFAYIDKLNEYIQEKKPWETKDSKVLYQLANGIKDSAILLYPFIPETSEKIANTFNFNFSLKELTSPLNITTVKKSEILFKKI